MKQAVWTGSINFGLVTIPVKLYPATEPKDVRFHLYDRRTGKRVRYERVVREREAPALAPEAPALAPVPPALAAGSRPPTEGSPALGEPVAEIGRRRLADESTLDLGRGSADRAVYDEDVVRGVELPTGDLVTVSDEELEALAPARSRTIEIEEFVELAQIDPVFFEKSYHVAPVRGVGAEKPYVLLLRAMQAARMVGIGRFVLRTKPHLVAIRPLERSLGLETLYFGDEVRDPAEVAGGLPQLSVSERELRTAQQLIRALATDWVPEKHADVYRAELLELLRSKPASAPAEIPETVESPIGDLMAALKASVEAAKRKSERARPARAKRLG